MYNIIMDLINRLDFSTLNFMEQIRAPFLTVFFKIITFSGEWSFVLGALVLISLFFIIKKIPLRPCSLAVTVGGLGTAFVLKEIIHRTRPLEAIIIETSSSFPSAHAVVSVVFTLLFFICWL